MYLEVIKKKALAEIIKWKITQANRMEPGRCHVLHIFFLISRKRNAISRKGNTNSIKQNAISRKRNTQSLKRNGVSKKRNTKSLK